MLEIARMVSKLGNLCSSVLLTGESGTGKECIARLIHNAGGRRQGPFIAVNCGAIPESLLESELFGHESGSFTGATSSRRGLIAEAHGGTLFLDEIGDMPPALQAKMLRVLQDHVVRALGSSHENRIDFRLISATHRELTKRCREGLFREDLYYRISVIPLRIPPLRERREAIPYLIQSFVEKHSRIQQLPPPQFTEEAVADLCGRAWKGNVRELENFIERILVICRKSVIGPEDLPASDTEEIAGPPYEFSLNLNDVIDRHIESVLRKVNGHQGQAAEILGINRRTLYRHLRGLRHKAN